MYRRLAVIWLGLVAGCAGSTLPGGGEVIDARTGARVSFDAMVGDLLAGKAIYVGEAHDQEAHHAVQAAIVRAVYARDPSLAIGLEMVQRPFQAPLDAWVRGEIGEDELLAGVEWRDRWGFDFAMYRPIFEFARAHGIRIVALNAPKEITRAIARSGIGSLTPEQRSALPELDLGNAEHRAMVREALGGHDGMDPERLERFYTAQVVWDETMADTVAATLAARDAPHRMIVLAGDMHVRGGLGIPSRAARRGAAPYRVVLPVSDDEEREEPRPADFLVVVDE